MTASIDKDGMAHAKFSASGSSRWINCPGSIKAEEGYPNTTSSAAEEGTFAHHLADLCLKYNKDADFYLGDDSLDDSDRVVEQDMCDYVQEYLDFVRAHLVDSECVLYTEEKVDFSHIAPSAFGTLDSCVINPKEKKCDIFDLKYGKGIFVDAFENTQGMLYGLGILNDLDFLYDIETITIHIVQPRMDNFSAYTLKVEDLKKFGKFAKSKAKLAISENPPRIPGEKQCGWCKAKGNCKALFDFTEKTIVASFDNLDEELDPNSLSLEQKRSIMDNKKLIEDFFKSIESSVFELLYQGEEFPGYKLVRGKSNRQFTEAAEKVLIEKLGDKAYKPKQLIGITDIEKLLGKEKDEIMPKITYKPEGKVTLAVEGDGREPVIITTAEDMFANLDDEDDL